mmetsp:Transcript_104126/g.324663  ORF Transcript_104126/g.324663 Transcript_104126/m.324663 type:complete len:421 (+) Transcript_104126:54-1316(+)|eukprot:CAMPEP_0204595536 /NCGR_PEP_ID=MMETSP0661-20131031/52728_1 /ASSEMBLY_ACC=CAM_ASM_000606 /TAXON_ID=109239 /ORGANISM="Alexandrium margalefi, Strain AMGDE01CS-322" /LENGTH=420 /DNA_ID=CAMNT_0051606071 /DNA_START=45 /DNA_END=1307 /DNA_ORIENTATION=+
MASVLRLDSNAERGRSSGDERIGGESAEYEAIGQEDTAPENPMKGMPKQLQALFEEVLNPAQYQSLADGSVEETWEFEADTYAVAIIAIVKEGLPSALPQLGLALFTPVIQTTILFIVFENLVATPGTSGDASDGVEGEVIFICFLLMALQLSNEALEGMWKVCFCMRCFGDVYSGLKGPAWVTLVLAYMQFTLAVFTVGCSMLVVTEQTSAIDAFMNFVALAFLTETDNLLISCRTVRNFIGIDSEIKVLHARKGGQDESTPWTPRMAVCCNVLLAVGIGIYKQATDIATAALGHPPDPFHRVWEVVSIAVALLVLNSAMWFGSRLIGTMRCATVLSFSCMTFVIVDQLFLYKRHYRMTPALLPAVPFWFGMLAQTSGNSVVKNPFIYLRCPFSTPSLVWAMLVVAVFYIYSLHAFDTA